MTLLFSILLVILSVSGIALYRDMGKNGFRDVSGTLTPLCVSGSVTMILCAVLTVLKSPSVLPGMFSAYYIAYAITVFLFARFVYAFSTHKKREVLSSPLFYGNLLLVILLLFNIYSRNVFSLSEINIAGHAFPHADPLILFWLYFGFITLEAVFCVIWLFSSLFKSAGIYRGRYIIILIVIFFQLGIEIISTVFKLPDAIRTLFMMPEWAALIYLCGYYSTKKLTGSVLNYVADNHSNGLMIYDENDKLIYRNGRIESMIGKELPAVFEDKTALDEWSSDLVEFNDIFVRKIEKDGQSRYIKIEKHEFTDNDACIGTSYSFQDHTDSFERFAMIEEANEQLRRAAHMKSDFLANMSHEIRTPMNVVIGLAEMALREEMTDQAREYLAQIKSSGRNLLNIINDILDFSKIESGKMDIIPENYEPLSEINDVANTLVTRVGDKDIELTWEANPDIPSKLNGDVLRIRQILINLANNAIKFTQHGRVHITTDFETISDDEIMLRFHVSDTGQGIKKEDLKKLFVSFQQVDSKRNRSIEGTGLGLAISKSLVEVMNGNIGVESEYGKGSDFYFEIPQKVIDPTPSITVNSPEKIFAFGMFNKKYLARRFFLDASRLGVYTAVLRFTEDYESTCKLYDDMLSVRRKYIFFEESDYTTQVRELLLNDPELIGVMLAAFNSTFRPDLKNLRVIRKPFSTASIAMALNNLELHLNSEDTAAYVSDFTAPDAKVLIVDDNMVNLTVAEGLLEPLKMKVVCAASGKEAIDKINTEKFDIVFMDHMMPEMDGVETTHVIRRMYPELANMPIIALTANAVSGVKESFIKEGMNDFVPKPIEVRDFMAKVRQWLPEKMIKKGHEIVNIEENEPAGEGTPIQGIDIGKAVAMIGSAELYDKIVKEYCRNIAVNSRQLDEAYDKEDWKDYTIKVHALKSSSRQIGADELADMAAGLEAAGKSGDIDYIRVNNQEVLDRYLALEKVLKAYLGEKDIPDDQKTLIDKKVLADMLERIISACDELDMDAMEAVTEELGTYSYPDDLKDDIDSIKESAELMDVFACRETAQKLLDM